MSFEKTLAKFGYPGSLIIENDHWYTLLRREQITFGSMILITKNEKNSSISKLNISEQAEMFLAIQKIEDVAFKIMNCDKINYLALMMVDPYVHFHILPRFKKPVDYNNIDFIDPGYPSVADLGYKTQLTEPEFSDLVKHTKELFDGK